MKSWDKIPNKRPPFVLPMPQLQDSTNLFCCLLQTQLYKTSCFGAVSKPKGRLLKLFLGLDCLCKGALTSSKNPRGSITSLFTNSHDSNCWVVWIGGANHPKSLCFMDFHGEIRGFGVLPETETHRSPLEGALWLINQKGPSPGEAQLLEVTCGQAMATKYPWGKMDLHSWSGFSMGFSVCFYVTLKGFKDT